MSKAVDLFILYNIIKKLTKPFEKWDAFEAGIIDEKGKTLRKATKEEKNTIYTKFDILIKNLKVMLAAVPGGRSRLATFAAALIMLKEDNDYLLDNEDMLESLLKEEITNTVGAGNIAGAGVNSSKKQEPFRKKKKKKGKLDGYLQHSKRDK